MTEPSNPKGLGNPVVFERTRTLLLIERSMATSPHFRHVHTLPLADNIAIKSDMADKWASSEDNWANVDAFVHNYTETVFLLMDAFVPEGVRNGDKIEIFPKDVYDYLIWEMWASWLRKFATGEQDISL